MPGLANCDTGHKAPYARCQKAHIADNTPQHALTIASPYATPSGAGVTAASLLK